MKKIKLDKLTKLRNEKGYSMKYMAKTLGICESYYCQLENGQRNLYYSLAIKIADIFNMTPDELFLSN